MDGMNLNAADGALDLPKKVAAVERKPLTPDDVLLVADLQQYGERAGNDPEQLILAWLADRYGHEGRQLYLHTRPSDETDNATPLEVATTAASGEGGVLADAGFAAMSLTGSPGRKQLVAGISAAHRAGIIDADLAGSYLDLTSTPALREATLKNLQYSIRKCGKRKAVRMSLNAQRKATATPAASTELPRYGGGGELLPTRAQVAADIARRVAADEPARQRAYAEQAEAKATVAKFWPHGVR